MSLQPCGTYAAYQRHRKNGEDPCAECRIAAAQYQAQTRATRPEVRRRHNQATYARSRALTRLKAMHPGEYRALYAEEMDR